MFYQVSGRDSFPVMLIGQWLVMDAFLFVGLTFGATDLIIKTKSMATRATLYIATMILLSKMVWNPFESGIKFFGTTFLYNCCVTKKGYSNCLECSNIPCDIWKKTREPKFSDAEF